MQRWIDDGPGVMFAQAAAECSVDWYGAVEAVPAVAPNQVRMKLAPRTMQLREYLSTKTGASLNEICAAFGWQSHSARAALTGLRKSGSVVERINFATTDQAGGTLEKAASRFRIGFADGATS